MIKTIFASISISCAVATVSTGSVAQGNFDVIHLHANLKRIDNDSVRKYRVILMVNAKTGRVRACTNTHNTCRNGGHLRPGGTVKAFRWVGFETADTRRYNDGSERVIAHFFDSDRGYVYRFEFYSVDGNGTPRNMVTNIVASQFRGRRRQ